ncbi:DNA-binding transcriptional response regulator, NtrC family, contains REC, AAA-type ATPase, and a Fis-type DNA-binding domains [Candidatus Kryptonium thompsonii]|uniref:DNA-binding transcriptional response regulator, NtrC family, contains REC, AAA-type ATPase, and a Fis-type DNA-binding domains n=1 Tax=Candidatus Kryptonium thompsonii TaxID=1633631 RepID=A0A0P1LUF4_9BACT|nr:sigma-54 dependent transcriptional regulator [Candidatus Kryptonium thompsoni]CUS82755.1 DNA-binding transcriptional response regulator, NtrC family, contains REC, AAA-type ATPase, and a Fis-type DNA-binding domains [Candidatus Kryptonium thompsoni]CUS84344.1 DNA-binding transcriptional response regulator, NtrC family, contains REC, AAA-type ATPase, and a Fis-type DNA-binding domains [Candidatus Kryptonium thompsoni]CUS85478.1 DNA-binding transcriptional response regulator, NtrC family, conta
MVLKEDIQEKYGIYGESQAVREIIAVIKQVAPTDITVLITGESGVGKELVARAIHGESKRADGPFVIVNSGAIPEGILESELFGHEKGAFTGAIETRKGYFEMADGGTIFLDEIGDMPIATQVKILRVIETGEFMRVGSSQLRKVDVRVIAATNKNLDEEVKRGNFREDLYYRLRTVNIYIPPLRERREDIPVLFEKFVAQFCERNKVAFAGITDDAMQILISYHWPGNVRELKNFVESILVLESGKVIDANMVRKYLRYDFNQFDYSRNLPIRYGKSGEQADRELIYRALVDIKSDLIEIRNLLGNFIEFFARQVSSPLALPEAKIDLKTGTVVENFSLVDMEKRMIKAALERFNWNKRLAARALKISERTLYRKIKEYGLEEERQKR